MCIAIVQYYPIQSTAGHCWGYEYGNGNNIGDCADNDVFITHIYTKKNLLCSQIQRFLCVVRS